MESVILIPVIAVIVIIVLAIFLHFVPKIGRASCRERV